MIKAAAFSEWLFCHRVLNISGDGLLLEAIKNYIKTKPRVYDMLNSRRPIVDDVEVWLDNFSKQNNGQVNFIQIGASDGLRWDPFRRFIIENKWNGVFVEPLPNVFGILVNNYAYVENQDLRFVNAAISIDDSKHIDIWSYSEDFCNSLSLEEKLCYLRKSSLDKTHVESSLSGLDNIDSIVKCYRVKCISINSLVKEYTDDNQVDLILIDAEGYDDKIVETIDFELIQPKAILFESHNLGERKKEIRSFLEAKGYVVTDIGGDTVAQRV